MTLLRSLLISLVSVAALSGCVLPGGDGSAPAADGAAPAEIEVSALPAPGSAATADADKPAPGPGTETADSAPEAAASAGADAAEAEKAAAPEEIAPLEEAPPAEVKTPGQIACEKGKGRFVRVGSSSAFTCIRPTRDGGKRCTRAGNCEGVCLARSGTCSPFTPVFGCQEILQDDGLRITECIE